MKNQLNLILIAIVGLVVVIGCNNSNSNTPTAKPASFANYTTTPSPIASLTPTQKAKIKKRKTLKTPSNTEASSDDFGYIAPKTGSTAPKSDSGYYLGPRGGCYAYTSGGRKRYVDRSLCH